MNVGISEINRIKSYWDDFYAVFFFLNDVRVVPEGL